MMQHNHTTGISPTLTAIVAKAQKATINVELANPFRPSIILMALATPPVANAVKTIDIQYTFKIKPSPGMPKEVKL